MTFHFVYDKAGRAVETWGERPGLVDPALAPEAPATLRDGRPAKGVFHCRFEYGDDYTEVVDSVRMQRFTRGPAGKIAKAVSARGGVTTRTFDDRDRVTSLTDPTGATWSWRYDDMDAIVLEESPDGHKVGLTRDRLGREVEVIDPAGGVTAIERDEQGELLAMRNQKGGVTQLLDLERGVAREMVDERGRRHRFELDAQGNCVARTFPNGARYEFTFDHWGRLLTVKNPLGHTMTLRYSPSGLLTQEIDPLGRTTTYRYDPMRNLVATTLADGSSTTYDYGGLNWLTRIGQPDGTDVRMLYNREGWLLYVVNERGERSERTYFEDGNLQSERRFHGATLRYERDLLGRIVGFDEGDGLHEIKRNASGQVLEHAPSDGPAIRYEYDARGEMTLAASPEVAVAFEPDAMGRVAKESVTIEGRTYEVESARDQAGDRRSVRTSLGHELSIQRDALGRVAEITDRSGHVVALVRTPVGAVQHIALPGGAAIVDTRDAANRLRRRQVTVPGEAPDQGQPERVGGARPGAVDRQYEYTPVDELLSVSTGNGEPDVFEYDLRRRLTGRQGSGGRREELRVDGCSNYSEAGVGRPTRTYGPGNLLTSHGNTTYRHDERGYLIEKTVHPESATAEPEVWRYTWDAFGMLQRVDRPDGLAVEFSYDSFARRVAKRSLRGKEVVSRTHYVWDLASLLHEVKVGDGGEALSVRTYLYEDSTDAMPLGHRDSGGAGWVYYVEDAIGTPTDLVDAEGRLVGRLERTTFGKARPAAGSRETTQFRYPG